MTEIQLTTLSNGMRVVTVPMAGLQSLTVLAMVGVGSRFEANTQAGLSHFLEHLPFKGTERYPTSLALAEAVDGVGGKHNAFTSKEYTGYWVKLASSKWRVALDVVSDLLLTAQLREEDIEREKGVIVEEINMYEDEPAEKVGEVFDGLVYAGSPLAREIIGSKKTVTSFGREDFLHHYDRWYNPENVVVGIVGGIEEIGAGMMEEVENYFGKGKKRNGGGERKFGLDEQKSPRVKIVYKKTEQAHFHLGFPGLSWRDENRYVLGVLTTVLGGNSSSRLFNEIREKRGLAYYAYASSDMFEDTGSVFALEGVALAKIEEAIKVTIEEFGRATDAASITEAEVSRAIEYMTGKLTLDLEDSASMANLAVRKALLEGKVETPEEIIAKIKAVTREQVAALAGRLLDMRKVNLAVVGPFKESNTFEKLVA